MVAAVARPAAPWLADLREWASAAHPSVDLVICRTARELQALQPGSGPLSAAVLDGRWFAVDRQLLVDLGRQRVRTLVVDDDRHQAASWIGLGASQVLRSDGLRAHLDAALADGTRRLGPAASLVRRRGTLIAVVGGSGAGTSTVAGALAQELAAPSARRVVLADLALHAHQALLHGIRPPAPGLPELVEAHRRAALPPSAVLDLTHVITSRGYRLLPGLRHHRQWTTLAAAPVQAALSGLLAAATHVVADIDADLEGEADTGSLDVEDRNLLARSAVALAEVVVAIARPTPTGLADLTVLVDDLRRAGVAPDRVVVAITTSTDHPRVRDRATDQVADALTALPGAIACVPYQPGVVASVASIGPFPEAIARPVHLAVEAILRSHARRPPVDLLAPQRIRPGELGLQAQAGSMPAGWITPSVPQHP